MRLSFPPAHPAWLAVSVLFAAAAPAQARSLTVTATAYNSIRAQTDGTPHVGACNKPIRQGVNLLAVSPDLMKMGLDCGTQVKVEGFGNFVVWDKMDDRWKRRIDIHMGKKVGKAEEWGEKKVRIRW
ncbi:3D domain-containing protein [Methylomagnum sp.]